MKRNTLYALSALALVLGASAPQAQAQRGNINAIRNFGRMLDPGASGIRTLLRRDDVKSEIRLSQRQGEQLHEIEDKAQTDAREQMKANLPDAAAFGSLKDLSDEERSAKMQELNQKMREARQANEASISAEVDKKAETILQKDQIARLHQLDLQWRGPLALSDKKVADKFNLTPEQRGKVTAILADYRKSQNDMFVASFAAMKPANPDPNAPPQRPDPAALEAKITEMQEKLDKVRSAQGDKVLALLTDDQKAAWTAAQGAKFSFRKSE